MHEIHLSTGEPQFELHPRLAQDTWPIGDFPLCRLLLMDNANYPWFVLVPRRAALREIFEMTPCDQQQLLQESSHLSEALYRYFRADKLNIAALGNMVPQLHIHHIVRYRGDRAWPNPVWGRFPDTPYSAGDRQGICTGLSALLAHFKPHGSRVAPPGAC